MDASHFVLNPYLCAVWCAVRLFIKAPTGRQRLNVVGAVNAISKQIITLCNGFYVNAEVIADFLTKFKIQGIFIKGFNLLRGRTLHIFYRSYNPL